MSTASVKKNIKKGSGGSVTLCPLWLEYPASSPPVVDYTSHVPRLTPHVCFHHRLTLAIQFPHHSPTRVDVIASSNATNSADTVAVSPQNW